MELVISLRLPSRQVKNSEKAGSRPVGRSIDHASFLSAEEIGNRAFIIILLQLVENPNSTST